MTNILDPKVLDPILMLTDGYAKFRQALNIHATHLNDYLFGNTPVLFTKDKSSYTDAAIHYVHYLMDLHDLYVLDGNVYTSTYNITVDSALSQLSQQYKYISKALDKYTYNSITSPIVANFREDFKKTKTPNHDSNKYSTLRNLHKHGILTYDPVSAGFDVVQPTYLDKTVLIDYRAAQALLANLEDILVYTPLSLDMLLQSVQSAQNHLDVADTVHCTAMFVQYTNMLHKQLESVTHTPTPQQLDQTLKLFLTYLRLEIPYLTHLTKPSSLPIMFDVATDAIHAALHSSITPTSTN